ncbi:MAG: YdbC family protein [Anaerovoracaceae bacterium]
MEARNTNSDRDIKFEIREHVGTLSTRSSGWSKELNIVSWNGQEPPKFDLRDWSADHRKMSKGITLYADELEALDKLYREYKADPEKGQSMRSGQSRSSAGSAKEAPKS